MTCNTFKVLSIKKLPLQPDVSSEIKNYFKLFIVLLFKS